MKEQQAERQKHPVLVRLTATEAESLRAIADRESRSAGGYLRHLFRVELRQEQGEA